MFKYQRWARSAPAIAAVLLSPAVEARRAHIPPPAICAEGRAEVRPHAGSFEIVNGVSRGTALERPATLPVGAATHLDRLLFVPRQPQDTRQNP